MKKTLSRSLNLSALLQKKTHFLFGPRSVGKTTLIKEQLSKALYIDLLDSNYYLRLAQNPNMLSEFIQKQHSIVVIDEIQKLPILLDEIHRLIELKNIRFLLTGSSAKKLKNKNVNLLGGRAWKAVLLPLTSQEIPNFNLEYYLNRGGMPHIYLSKNYQDELKNYVNLYIREEIMAESLIRRLDYFTKFLDVIALNNGEELHYQGLASDAGVPAKTFQNYIQILEDTLVGFPLYPFQMTKKRKAITRSKFFLFDIGIVNFLTRRGKILPKSELFGKAFEHFIVLELRAYLAYTEKNYFLSYWRSTSGFEVDLIIGDVWAFEIKATNMVSDKHLKGLKALKEEKCLKNYAIISQDPTERVVDGICIFPWKIFLKKLWNNELLS